MTVRNHVDAPSLAEGDFDAVAPILRALGHPDRLRMVERLMREDLNVGELAERLHLAPNAVSQHLNLLAAHGVVQRRREGRHVHYEVVHPAARSLLQCMHKNRGQL
jgi:ArsR family transcriptional regulator